MRRPGLPSHSRGRLARRLAAAFVLALTPALGGCALLATNVRAEREYANEDPELDVVLHRIDDAEATLKLVDKVLTKVPYAPGDAWVRDIALGEARAAEIKKGIAAKPPYSRDEHEIPVVSMYRVHIEQVLRRAEAPRQPATYPSVLDAIAALTPGAASIKTRWEEVVKAQAAHGEAIKAKATAAAEAGSLSARYAEAKQRVETTEQDAERATKALNASAEALRKAYFNAPSQPLIARDAASAASVALRVLLESGALLSAVSGQASHLYYSAERDIWVRHAEKEMVQLSSLPPRVEGLRAQTKGEGEAFEPVADALAGLTNEELYTGTPGFVLRESIIDQAMAVNWDSVRLRVRGDGEVLLFNQIGVSGETNPGYLGQTRRLAYDVDPIALVGARLIVAYDWVYVRNAARLNAGFATDRVFGTGGDIVNSASLGAQLGLTGFASDVFDIGMDVIGIRAKAKVATFTSGEVQEIAVEPGTGSDKGVMRTAPLQLAYTQIDVGYDVAFLLPEFAGKYWIEEMLVGFRYMNYRLPRILYELEDVDPDPEVSRYAFSRESPAQTLDSRYFMGGIAARFGQGDRRVVSLFGDVGIYGGSGPASFYFLKDAAAGDTPGNRAELSPAMVVFNASAGLGVRFRLTPRKMRFRLLCELQYHGEFVGQAIVSEIRETRVEDKTVYTIGKTINYGGVDVYHGPRLQIVGVF
jgi:hypothetical protein